ncbi:RNA-binding protein, putative [Trypanosoma equiperdum]|uniref:RanBP2-type domain-containing protein n=2 Tax=Trypanozoon TaxID=39700 RepID=Q580S9_TRYB2|nr:hypothetical protein, conserved [Trypanosoma brucei brucei TREU927]AAX81055.1 hypothetical protein, conserved [Trypanosoma brucei]AAZ10577.1 hypothetical protein, conserved [Trypanosoma brucei brucei TREU927]SCU66875.1 RNA-binding protein, putative [Trypanosoma equiperdum]
MEGRKGKTSQLRGGPKHGHPSGSRSNLRSRQRDGNRHWSPSHRDSRDYKKRFRSPSPNSGSVSRSSSRGSASYSGSSVSDSYSSDSSARFDFRRRRWSPSHRSGGTAGALSYSKGYDVGDSDAVLDHPTTDWVCGVCSNPNSVNREDCYRCGATFSASVNAVPSEEVKVSNIPNGVTFADIGQRLGEYFSQYGDTCRIIAHDMDNVDTDESGGSAYLLFEGVVEATKALTYARSALLLGDIRCPMEFSLQGRAKKKLNDVWERNGEGSDDRRGGVSLLPAPPPAVEGLPDDLQPAVWKPVENFPSVEAEMNYLDMLSHHWSKLSQAQKDYYDEGVRRALAAQRRKQPSQQVTETSATSRGETNTVNAPTSSGNPSPQGNGSSLESIKKRLEEKKKSMQNVTEVPKVAASLKERLAMKKAQLSSAAKPGNATESDAVGSTTAVSSTFSPPSTASVLPPSQKESAASQQHLFFGIPIPPRFPAKTDYLLNSKSLPARAGVIFRYVPPAVAERILQPPLLPHSS